MKKGIGCLLGLSLLFAGSGAYVKNVGQAQQSKNIEKTIACSVLKNDDFNRNIRENLVKTSVFEDKQAIETHAKSAYLADFGTGTVMFAQNETQHLPIASMCKIMTLLLSFEAIDAGVMTMDDEICVSENASSMGGSQVFLEANAKYPVRELIKSVVVCSANDSSVALAEKIAGSEMLFVDKMNDKAKELGANDTLFANCTGLPKEPQYSCAKDVFLMLQALLKHEEYHEFGKVWLDKFAHPKGRYTEITNTNKLVRSYDGCDGGKTGFTNQAGFCLAATAKRDNMRVISVVIGEENSKTRFDDVRTMFDYAFANYTVTPIVDASIPLEKMAIINGGKQKSVQVCAEETTYSFIKRGEKANVKVETHFNTLKAPIKKGQRVGEMIIFKDNVEVTRVGLIARESVAKATVFDRIMDVARAWNKRK